MTNINFKLRNGELKKIDAEDGLTLMEVARDNDLGIEGTCGGSISCCTCHVVIEKDWFSKVGPANPDEEDMLDLLLKNRESLLHAQLINNVHLISFEQLNIKLRLKFKSDTEILKNLSSTLEKITKNKWNVTHSEEDGEKTIVEKQNIKLNEQKEQIKANPHFAEVFKHFPQAEITSIEDKKSN